VALHGGAATTNRSADLAVRERPPAISSSTSASRGVSPSGSSSLSRQGGASPRCNRGQQLACTAGSIAASPAATASTGCGSARRRVLGQVARAPACRAWTTVSSSRSGEGDDADAGCVSPAGRVASMPSRRASQVHQDDVGPLAATIASASSPSAAAPTGSDSRRSAPASASGPRGPRAGRPATTIRSGGRPVPSLSAGTQSSTRKPSSSARPGGGRRSARSRSRIPLTP